MNNKKEYTPPSIHTEVLEIGVFGFYSKITSAFSGGKHGRKRGKRGRRGKRGKR